MNALFRSAVLGDYNVTADYANRALDLAYGYRPFVAAMPEAAYLSIPALATYEPRVSVPKDSWLWAISGLSKEADGFSVQVTDSATKKPLFSQPAFFGAITGQGVGVTVLDAAGQAQTYSNPLMVLPKALAILTPGVLTVKIQNLAAAANRLQLCLHFAIRTPAADDAEMRNAWNVELDREIDLAMRAIREAGSGVTSTKTALFGGTGTDDLIPVAYDVTALGDNTVIAGNAAGKIVVYQLDLWNVAPQTITFKSGATMLRGPLVNFPGQSAYGLGNSGKPHFECAPGQPFIIELSGGTQATGFIRYRIE